MIKNIALVTMALVILLSSMCSAASYKLVEDTYTAEEGDSLDSVTVMYMAKNTYGKREFKEFKSGIVQLNSWLLERDLQAGDEIRINFWVETEDN